MEGMAVSQSQPINSNSLLKFTDSTPAVTTIRFPLQFAERRPHRRYPILRCSTVNSSEARPLVVFGSANADIYVEIDRLPREGETLSAKNGQTLAGGKGANQAACGGKLRHPTYFVGQIGRDAHGTLISESLHASGVHLDYLRSVPDVPTGHAVVMLQSDGQNSIIIVGGSNMGSWPKMLPAEDLELLRNAGIVLLQREIPDSVNIQVAKAAKSAGVPVILDAGGMDTPIPHELLNSIDIFSPNESELGRLTGMPTESSDQISQAVAKCHRMGVKQVLVKLGSKGSALYVEGEKPIIQPIVSAARVVDTTGAGDTFTASFAVAMVEGKSKDQCLKYAGTYSLSLSHLLGKNQDKGYGLMVMMMTYVSMMAMITAAAASLCVQVKGAIPSMPDRESVSSLVRSVV